MKSSLIDNGYILFSAYIQKLLTILSFISSNLIEEI